MTRGKGSVVVTIKIIGLGHDAHLQENIHTVVLMSGKEGYPEMHFGLDRFFESVKDISEHPLTVEGIPAPVNVEFLLCSE